MTAIVNNVGSVVVGLVIVCGVGYYLYKRYQKKNAATPTK